MDKAQEDRLNKLLATAAENRTIENARANEAVASALAIKEKNENIVNSIIVPALQQVADALNAAGHRAVVTTEQKTHHRIAAKFSVRPRGTNLTGIDNYDFPHITFAPDSEKDFIEGYESRPSQGGPRKKIKIALDTLATTVSDDAIEFFGSLI